MNFENLLQRMEKLSTRTRSELYVSSHVPHDTVWQTITVAELHLAQAHLGNATGTYALGYWNSYLEVFSRPRSLVIQDFVYKMDGPGENSHTLYLGKPDGYLMDLVKAFLVAVRAHSLHPKYIPFEELEVIPNSTDEEARNNLASYYKDMSYHYVMVKMKRFLALGKPSSALMVLINFLYASDKIVEFDNCVELFFNYDQAKGNYPIEVDNEEGEIVSTSAPEGEGQAVQPAPSGSETV